MTTGKNWLQNVKSFHLILVLVLMISGGLVSHYLDILGMQGLKAQVDTLKKTEIPKRDAIIGANQNAITQVAKEVKANTESLKSFKKDYFHQREVDSILNAQRHRELLRAIKSNP
jgi:hypothetical protein